MKNERKAVFTSANYNYLPKALVLANSVKKVHPDLEFHLVVSDLENRIEHPELLNVFDKIVYIDHFDFFRDKPWLFKRNVVELCTCVKPFYLDRLLAEGYGKVIYLDPDTQLYSRLDPVLDKLERASICLTPHITDPQSDLDAIYDHEISAAKHGVYNLGFFAVSASSEGKRFARWWSERNDQFGFSQTYLGMFTDQKICDFVPCYFDEVDVIREPNYNVAHWNLGTRNVTRTGGNYYVNGKPLIFYHFSGYDSGAGKRMIDKYAVDDAVGLLWEQYNALLQVYKKDYFEKIPWSLGHFNDGQPISHEMRFFYRHYSHLSQAFPDPYAGGDESFQSYWQHSALAAAFSAQEADITSFIKSTRPIKSKQDFLKSLTEKLRSAKHRIVKSPVVYLYGANDVAEFTHDFLRYLGVTRFKLIDESGRGFGELKGVRLTDIQPSAQDSVVVCGIGSNQNMRIRAKHLFEEGQIF